MAIRPGCGAAMRPGGGAGIRPGGGAGMQQRYQPARVGPPVQNNLHALEQRFSKQVNDLVEGLMDLNVPCDHLDRSWTQLSNLRITLLQAHGVTVVKPPMTIKPAPKMAAHGQQSYQGPYAAAANAAAAARAQQGYPYGAAANAAATARAAAAANALPDAAGFSENGGNTPANWKGKLLELYSKAIKRPLVKDDISYAVEECPGGGYICTLTCEGFSNNSYAGPAAPSKKLAEHCAAREALMGEFPDGARQMEMAMRGQVGAVSVPQAQAAQQTGVKRKGVGPDDAKSRLSQGIQLVLGRPLTKGDILYESSLAEDASGAYVATVRFPEYDQMNTYYGTQGANKKQAEMNAAEEALNQMRPIFLPLEEEHRAKKMRQSQEKLAQFKAGKQEAANRAGIKQEQQPGTTDFASWEAVRMM